MQWNLQYHPHQNAMDASEQGLNAHRMAGVDVERPATLCSYATCVLGGIHFRRFRNEQNAWCR